MVRSSLAYLLVAYAIAAAEFVTAQTGNASLSQACSEIKSQISTSGGYYDSDWNLDFRTDVHHWFFDSSSQTPECVIEPGTPQDVSVAMTVISKYRVPFALYSAGHASNPGFSSTTGVHIAMRRMNQVTLSPDKSTVELGYGLSWADVYEALNGTGVNVVGGRVTGPGVGGFTLGGGFSWKTNQYGLTSDTVQEFNVVLANGTITTASASSNPDLYFALKGGLNRFAAVTSAVYYTNPQTDQVYAGLAVYTSDQVDDVINATQVFQDTNKDPKAQIITTLDVTDITTAALVLFFYDGPDAGDSFQMFEPIKDLVDLVKAQTFASFVSSADSRLQPNPRGSFNTLSTTGTNAAYLAAVRNQTETLAAMASDHGAVTLSYDIEPFLQYGQHATDGAFPHSDSPLPLNLYFSWLDEDEDAFWQQTLRDSVSELKQVAQQQGLYNASSAIYPNYAIAGTTAEQMYGAANVARLQTIRDAYDPDRVMDLAGGFTI